MPSSKLHKYEPDFHSGFLWLKAAKWSLSVSHMRMKKKVCFIFLRIELGCNNWVSGEVNWPSCVWLPISNKMGLDNKAWGP